MKKILKYSIVFFFFTTFPQAAIVGTIETLREVTNGSATTCGSPSFYSWYNYEDDQYARSNGTRAVRITWTGLSADTRYYLYYKKTQISNGSTSNGRVSEIYKGTDTGNLVFLGDNSFVANATTMYTEIDYAYLAGLISGDATHKITFGLNTSDSAPGSFQGKLSGASGVHLTFDLTRPTISNAQSSATNGAYGNGGETVTITGNNFNAERKDDNAVEGIFIGSGLAALSTGAITYTSGTEIEITTIGGSSNLIGNVFYRDNGCNVNASGPIYRHDPKTPVITGVSVPVVKEGVSATVSGSGFLAGSGATGIKTLKIGATTLGTGYWNVVNDGSITITGPNSEISAGALGLLDSAGNSLTSGTNFAVDITAPSITGITISNAATTIAKQGQTVRIAGAAGGWKTNGEPTIAIEGTGPGSGLFTISGATNDAYIDILIGSSSTAENSSPTVIVTDFAGNSSADGGPLDIDNRVPTITGVGTRYISNGGSSVITGSGFANTDGGTIANGEGSGAVHLGGTNLVSGGGNLGGTFSTTGPTNFTINAGTGECTDCNIRITDKVGNQSVDDANYKITIDNTVPVVSGLTNVAGANSQTQVIAKQGDVFKINGDKFSEGAPTAPESTLSNGIQIGGSTPAGLAWVASSDDLLTVTAGSGEVADGVVKVNDASGNQSSATNRKVTIDNTAPNNITLAAGGANEDQTARIFKNGDILILTTSAADPGSFVNNGHTPGGGTADPVVKIDGTDIDDYANLVINSATQITITFNTNDNVNGALTVTDAAGNQSASLGQIHLDNSIPQNLTVTTPVIRQGETTTITTSTTGTGAPGFLTGSYGDDSKVASVKTASGVNLDFTVEDDGQLTVTAGATEFTDQQIIITDAAGNPSTQNNANIKMTVDNTAPTISGLSVASIKQNGTTVVSGAGFFSTIGGTSDATGVTVSVGGNLNTSAFFGINVGADNAITITGGTGDIIDGNIIVYDRAGNASDAFSNLDIDNTVPTVATKSVGSIKNGSTVTIGGGGFSTGTNELKKVEIGSLEATNDGNGGNDDFSVNWDAHTNSELIITASTGDDVDGQIKVTDFAGNISTDDVRIHVDNTKPVVNSVSADAYSADNGVIQAGANDIIIRQGGIAKITGTGFTIGTSNVTKIKDVTIGGQNLVDVLGGSFEVVSATVLNITGGATEVTDGNVVLIDSAGNPSTDVAKLLTIDNSPPIITSIESVKGNQLYKVAIGANHGTTAIAKSGDTFKVHATGGGFIDQGKNASSITIGSKDLETAVGAGGLGGSFAVNSNTQLTITAGVGEATKEILTVKDAVGNESTQTIFKATIDNTAPATPILELTSWGDTGYSDSDNLTNNVDADFIVSNVVRGDSITIYENGVGKLSKMATNGDSNTDRQLHWESGNGVLDFDELPGAESAHSAGDGTFTFTATAIDSAGNASSAASLNVTYDTTPPSTPSIDYFGSSTLGSVEESGVDKITNDNTPILNISNVTTGNGVKLYYYVLGQTQNDLESVQVELLTDTLQAPTGTPSKYQLDIRGTYAKTGGDQTQDALNALPDSSDNIGLDASTKKADYRFYAVHYDSAGNTAAADASDFYIDTKKPKATLSYSTVPALINANANTGSVVQNPDSLMRFEDGELTIYATFTDENGNPDGMNGTTPPTISVDLPETTNGDVANQTMTVDPNNDHIWIYQLTPPDEIDGIANVTVDGDDNAGNELITASTIGSQIMQFDNTDPVPFTVGRITPIAPQPLKNPKRGYFNKEQDTLAIKVPMNSSDPSLSGGNLKMFMTIPGSNNLQIDSTIKISNYIDSLAVFMKKDSVRRKFSTTLNAPWKAENLVQGSKLITLATIFDKAGNSRTGNASLDTLVVDTIPPVKGSFEAGSIILVDEPKNAFDGKILISNDSIDFTITGFEDDKSLSETGLDYYEWSVGEFSDVTLSVSNEQDTKIFTSNSETSFSGTAPLKDSTYYHVTVRAIDNAGNRSYGVNDVHDVTLNSIRTSLPFWRENSSPTITQIDTVPVKEEEKLSYFVQVTDPDFNTLLSDTMKYYFYDTETLTRSSTKVLKQGSVAAEINENTGEITWNTPYHGETTTYPIDLQVLDMNRRKDEEPFILRVDKNERPRFSILKYDKLSGDSTSKQLEQVITDSLIMWENDTLKVVFTLEDIDDDTLTYTITADSSKLEVISLGSVVTTTPKTIEATFIPDKSWTKTTKINLAVSDGNVNGATRVNDTTFVMNVRRMPRPEFKLSIGQNPSFTRYYEFMVTDTTEKAKSLKMYVYKNNTIPVGEVKMDSLGLYTWVGGFEFDTTANYRFEMQGQGVVGDTTINDTVSHALARAKGAWRAMSSDGGFSVMSQSSNSVSFDKPFMIVDSLLFPLGEAIGGLYRMGHPLVSFEKPVMVTIKSIEDRSGENQAIHQLSGGSWKELTTIHKNGEIMAWTDQMGYFKIGSKTIIVPEETSLRDNYPNPFNSSTTIEFDVGFFGGPDQRISIGVYNILGQKIKNLHEGPLNFGHHVLRWNGRDMSEAPAASGVYLFRLISNSGTVQTKKMTLVR